MIYQVTICHILICLSCSTATHAASEVLTAAAMSHCGQCMSQCMSHCQVLNDPQLCSDTGMYGGACPTGLFRKDGHCECGVYPDHIASCNGTQLFMLNNYCATTAEENLISVGFCPHLPRHLPVDYSNAHMGRFYYPLEKDIHSLNNASCRQMNRTGTLCGRCLPDHYPLAYSYDVICIPCPHVRWNWLRYIIAAYLPLTFFYLILMFFKINTTSSHLFALVYYCQTMSMPALIRGIYLGKYRETKYFIAIKLYSSLYGVWNLDFFKPFYSDVCLGMGILPTLALDYLIAVYPLLLMVISYLLIVLYDRNYKVITIMWRPFRALLSHLKSNWNIRTSVIDAFSTFFLLSNVKFSSVSFDLLAPTRVYHIQESTYNYTLGLFYAGGIEYFGREHLPYAILAIATLCVFVILPVAILALYPFAFFQKFLNLLPVRWYILHTFVDSFQGCYKNGTEPNTRDCRWFASTFFIVRYFYFILYFSTAVDLFSCLVAMILLLHTSLLAIFQPFKSSHNIIHIVFLQILTLFAVLQSGDKFVSLFQPSMVHLILLLKVTCLATPLLYALAWTIHWLYSHRKCIFDQLRALITGYTPLPEHILPDRIENSGEYPRKNLANFAGRL